MFKILKFKRRKTIGPKKKSIIVFVTHQSPSMKRFTELGHCIIHGITRKRKKSELGMGLRRGRRGGRWCCGLGSPMKRTMSESHEIPSPLNSIHVITHQTLNLMPLFYSILSAPPLILASLFSKSLRVSHTRTSRVDQVRRKIHIYALPTRIWWAKQRMRERERDLKNGGMLTVESTLTLGRSNS